jgi:hypothetical protein
MDDASAMVRQDYEDEQHLECRVKYGRDGGGG